VQAGADIAAFRVVGEMGSTQAIKQAVKAGVGVSLVSRRAVEEECRAGSVWGLRVKDLKITRAFYLATHRERSRSPLAEAFRAFVEAEAV
jgi:DNA-binding transcriptional LysR family regulator